MESCIFKWSIPAKKKKKKNHVVVICGFFCISFISAFHKHLVWGKYSFAITMVRALLLACPNHLLAHSLFCVSFRCQYCYEPCDFWNSLWFLYRYSCPLGISHRDVQWNYFIIFFISQCVRCHEVFFNNFYLLFQALFYKLLCFKVTQKSFCYMRLSYQLSI